MAVSRKLRIAVSVVLGLLAVALTLLYTASVRDEAQATQREAMASYGGDVVRVCVATRDIEPGDAIDESNATVEDWVSSLLPSDAYGSIKEVLGKTATGRIPKRAVLSPLYFAENKHGLDVPEGMVAVSVASDAEHALGGTLERGDEVDVYISKDSIADRLTTAQVLDTSALAQGGGDITWVTLAVRPESVCELLSAASKAMVTLAASNGVVDGADLDGSTVTGETATAGESTGTAAAGSTTAGAAGGDDSEDGSGGDSAAEQTASEAEGDGKDDSKAKDKGEDA